MAVSFELVFAYAAAFFVAVSDDKYCCYCCYSIHHHHHQCLYFIHIHHSAGVLFTLFFYVDLAQNRIYKTLRNGYTRAHRVYIQNKHCGYFVWLRTTKRIMSKHPNWISLKSIGKRLWAILDGFQGTFHFDTMYIVQFLLSGIVVVGVVVVFVVVVVVALSVIYHFKSVYFYPYCFCIGW